MDNREREGQILDLLKVNKYAKVIDLAEELYTSPSSIRRDIRKLELRGLVKRSHGGVALADAQPGLAPFAVRSHENKREKVAIVRQACKLIKPDSSIFIDSSTTALNFAAFISAEMKVKVFTNNMHLAHLLAAKQVMTYCTGGLVSQHNNVITTGQFALDMLSHIYVDQFFFTSAAVSEEGLITDHNEGETQIRKYMLSHAKQNILLCPHDRYGLTATYKLTDMANVDIVVSDARFPQTFSEKFSHLRFM